MSNQHNTSATSVFESVADIQNDDGTVTEIKTLKICDGQAFFAANEVLEDTDEGCELAMLPDGPVVINNVTNNPFSGMIYLTRESAIEFFTKGLAYLKGEEAP